MTEPEIRAETTPMADELDLDALEAKRAAFAFSGNATPSVFMAIADEYHTALRNAAPALIAAARERDSLAAEMLQLRDEYALFRRDARALLDKAEKAMEPFAGIVGPFRAATETGRHHIPDEDFRRARDTLAEIRNAKATT